MHLIDRELIEDEGYLHSKGPGDSGSSHSDEEKDTAKVESVTHTKVGMPKTAGMTTEQMSM